MQLLEREDLVQKLDNYVTDLAGGAGALVCLTGEAGIGKTSVAQVIAERAGANARILWGACEDLSTPAPLAPLLDFAREGNWRLAPADDFASRIAFFEAAFEQLTSEPTLAILEDLHWADDATLDFVRFVARRLRGAPLLVLGTARDDSSESQARLRRLLADVPPDKYERIELRSLTEDTVRKIAIDRGQDGSAVYALTSGNPFLTMEVLKQGNDCPTTVRDALLWRADKLSPPARAALDAASVFPRRVECNVLEKMCAEDADGVLACLAGGLLQVEDDFYRFRHEIARRAIEAALSQPSKVRLNQRALEILKSGKTANTARLVHHAIEAHDLSAISVLAPSAAIEAANAGAHREATKHLRTSFEHVDTWEPNRRGELLERLGYELQLTGEINEAIESLQAALVLRQRCGNQLKVGDNLRWLSRLHYNAGERGQGAEIGRRAIDVLTPLGQTYELAMAYANLALICALRDDSKGAIELANKTRALAEELGHKELLADAHSTLGAAKQWLDRASSRDHFDEALTLALECDRPELVARIYMNAGNVELNGRAHKNARRWLQAGVRYCEQRDLLTWAVYMNGLLADLLVREGSWLEGEKLARGALEASKTPVQRFPSSAALARLHIRRGDGAAWLIDNLTFDTEPQRMMVHAPIVGERAWLLKLDVDASIEVLNKAAAVADAIGNLWAAGEIEYWRSKLEGKRPSALGKVAEPYALLFGGDWAGAADAWNRLEEPYERAMALLEGDEAARDEALGILDDLGATATASRARRELRARGLRGLRRGPRESTRSNPAGLTRREMEVLRLLDAGMPNAEIAARLNTALKTADHHVSAILTKLDSSSRLEAVTKARRLRLFDNENPSSS